MRNEVNVTYMNLETGDEQEVGVIEQWEDGLESQEALNEWKDMFRPELTEDEIDLLSEWIRDFEKEPRHSSYEKAVELLRPKVRELTKTLEWLEMERQADHQKWGVTQDQM